MGQTENPKDGAAVAFSIFIAVAVYGVCQPLTPILMSDGVLMVSFAQAFLVFCGLQAYLHIRASRRGQISLR